MRINSIQTTRNTYYKPISFRSTSANEAVLSIQNPDSTQFKRNMQRTLDADAVQSNPVKALVGKVRKSLDVFFNPSFANDSALTDSDISQMIEQRRYYL